MNKIFFLTRGLLLLFVLFGFCKAPVAAGPPEVGGLLGSYVLFNDRDHDVSYVNSAGINVTVPANENFFVGHRKENPKFPKSGFNAFGPEVEGVTGRIPHTRVIWRGAIYADVPGTYSVLLYTNNDAWKGMLMNRDVCAYYNPRGWCESQHGWDNTPVTLHLDAGWHRINFFAYYNDNDIFDIRAELAWKKPGSGSFEYVPNDYLSPVSWFEDEMTIPRDDSTDKKIDYVVSGAGAKHKSSAEIKIDMPAIDAKMLKDDVFVLWYNSIKNISENTKLMIKNEITGASEEITGKKLTSVASFEDYDTGEVYGWIPSSLIDDRGTGELHFSFTKSTGLDFKGGVAILVPFINDLSDVGQFVMKLTAGEAYYTASPAMIFELDDSQENTIAPLFFIADGETKERWDDPSGRRIRTSHMYMAHGDGTSSVDELTDIRTLGSFYLPKDPFGGFNPNDPDTWYPCYGREGAEFDVLSAKYVRNQHSSVSDQYLNSSILEGKLDEVTIPAGDDWVAFQYYGVNYPRGISFYDWDDVGGIAMDSIEGESTCITGGGILSLPSDPPVVNWNITVSVAGNGRVDSGGTISNCREGDSCVETFVDGINVTLTAIPDALNKFSGWTGDAVCADPANNVCTFTATAHVTVEANFDEISFPGQCGDVCNHTYCNVPPTDNFCTPPSTIAPGGPTSTASGLEWTCLGNNATTTTDDKECSARRECGWEEK